MTTSTYRATLSSAILLCLLVGSTQAETTNGPYFVRWHTPFLPAKVWGQNLGTGHEIALNAAKAEWSSILPAKFQYQSASQSTATVVVQNVPLPANVAGNATPDYVWEGFTKYVCGCTARVNSSITWTLNSCSTTGAGSNDPCYQTIASHELGHCTGVGQHVESYSKNVLRSVYIPTGPGGKWLLHTVTEYDRDIFQQLYAGAPSYKRVAMAEDADASPNSPLSVAPNPFNSSTLIRVNIGAPAYTQLRIFNSLGQQVRALHVGDVGPGTHTYAWDGRDDSGRTVSSGTYFARLEAPHDGLKKTQKLTYAQ